ncbi:maleylpyruvate isomerase family mycothiol-dependent enzyme [Actinophytocola sp.]|uniref:maleylpyruvate isomerase family mycothiol-dependent enzyme n=1 Tax=Actinophytocola sp. TaxID=1872138 RepID=UPI002EDA230C
MPKTGIPPAAAASRVTQDKWVAVRAALREAGDRFADLVLSVPDPSVLATKDWSVAETAAHVTGIAMNYTAMVSEGRRPLPIPEVRQYVPVTTVDTIHTGLNRVQLESFPERDPVRLAARLRGAVAEILSITEHTDPARVVPWLGDSRLPVAGVLAHMVNELLIHGWDVARAVKAPWRMPEDQAALFFELFLVEIGRNGYGHMLDDDRPVRPGRIAVEFRSAHTAPVTFVLESGVATVAEPDVPADVRVWFRPSTMNMVLFHRFTHLQAALRGSLRVWGRRPWLLPAFLRKVRLP